MTKEYIWPGMMLMASTMNMVGFGVAIATGAANNTVAFKTSFVTSAIYAAGSLTRIRQIYCDNKTHAERERDKKNQLTEIVIEK
jgi:hypothetical protein